MIDFPKMIEEDYEGAVALMEDMFAALKAIKRARGNCGASPFEQAACNLMDAAIAKAEGNADTVACDTVDSLTQAEAFIAGFEDDPEQEGVADILAGLRAAIPREQAQPQRQRKIRFPEDAPGVYRLHFGEASLPASAILLEEIDMSNRIVIVIEGGMVQSVSGTGSMIGRTVHIIDYDTDGADESELSEITQADGDTTEAILRTEIIDELTVTFPED